MTPAAAWALALLALAAVLGAVWLGAGEWGSREP